MSRDKPTSADEYVRPAKKDYNIPADPNPAPWAQELVDNLNRNVLRSVKAREPGLDWSTWKLGGRAFRVSPDGKDARERMADGDWSYVVAEYVITKAQRSPI
jgi:hypothetical protein